MEQKDSRAKRAGKSVANFLNRVNRGENDAIAAKRQEREKLMEIAADAGMTYATRGTNKLAAGAPKKAKGGELKGMKKIRLKKSFSDKYMPGVTHIYFDKSNSKYYFLDFEGDPMELKNKYVFEQLKKEGIIMAKGGTMKKDDKWIQSTVKEMEKKGTVGLFTKKAKRRGMTTKEFMREVLRNPKKYTLKTRREAQWMANVTGDEYEWGGKVDTGTDVADTLNSAYEYAKGGKITIDKEKYEYLKEVNKNCNEALNSIAKKGYAKGGNMKKQGYNDKLDESLSMRKGKASTKKQSDKDRRDESKGMEKSMGKRAYASVGTMDKTKAKKRLEEIRKSLENENISYGELAELESLKKFIDKDDVQLREAAGIPEFAKGGTTKKQGYNDKLDESLGNTDGKESTKKQSLKDRRDESKGEEKALGKRAYSSVSTMDKLLPFLSWHKK